MEVSKISPIPDGEVVWWRLRKDAICETLSKRKVKKESKSFEKILLEEMENESGSGTVGVYERC